MSDTVSVLRSDVPTVEDAIRVAEFRVALRRFFRMTEIAARESRLTPRQYLLLLLVKGAPDGSEQTTVGELCKRLYLAQSTVTELVSRAVDAGLVLVTQSDVDGRVSEIRLSAEGSSGGSPTASSGSRTSVRCCDRPCGARSAPFQSDRGAARTTVHL